MALGEVLRLRITRGFGLRVCAALGLGGPFRFSFGLNPTPQNSNTLDPKLSGDFFEFAGTESKLLQNPPKETVLFGCVESPHLGDAGLRA